MSVVHPRSRCAGCGAAVRSWDNVPILSFLLLRGRCRHCAAAIPWRYPIVELLTAALFAFFVAKNGVGLLAVRDILYSTILLGLIVTDLETRLLPDQFTFGGIAIGLIFAWIVPSSGNLAQWLFGLGGAAASLLNTVSAAVIPAGSLWLVGLIFKKIRKREGLGFGDIVMLAELGVFLGLQKTLLALVIASVTGSVIGLIWIYATRRDAETFELPLGSFLGAAGILMLAFGNPLLTWYAART